MLIFDYNGELASREPVLLCSFGIIEAIGAFLATVGVDAAVGASAAEIGLGAGFASDAAIAGGAGLGSSLAAGAGAGLAEAGAGLAASDLGLGAGFASDAAIAGGAGSAGTAGALGGGLAAGVAPSLISDAAGGATIAEGVPLVSTYGPVSAFATDAGAGLAAGGSGLVSDAAGGATIAEGVPLASTYGPVSTFATDLGGLSAGTPALDAGTSAGGSLSAAPSASPGLSSTAASLGATPPSGLGTAPAAGPGAGVAATTPSQAVIGTPGVLDPTAAGAQAAGPGFGTPLSTQDAAGFAGFQAGNVPQETAAIGADVSGASTGAGQVAADAANPATYGSTSAFATGDAVGTVGPATTAGTGASAPGGVLGQVGDFFSPVTNAVDKTGSFLASPTGKVLSTGVSGLALANDLLKSSQPNPIPGQADLARLATQLGAESQTLQNTGNALIAPNATAAVGEAGHARTQAATLENYLTTGTLPTPVQSALNRATDSAITDIKAKYASRGMPPGSSAEQQDIASVRQSAVIQGGTLAASLYSQGVGLDQLASQIYSGLVGAGTNLVGAGTSAAAAGVGAQENVVATNSALNTGLNNAIANLSSALGGGTKLIVNGNTTTAQAA